MKLDTLALIMVAIVAVIWVAMFFVGILTTPYGWLLFLVVAVPAYILYRVIRERMGNAEDDYYDKNVRQ